MGRVVMALGYGERMETGVERSTKHKEFHTIVAKVVEVEGSEELDEEDGETVPEDTGATGEVPLGAPLEVLPCTVLLNWT